LKNSFIQNLFSKIIKGVVIKLDNCEFKFSSNVSKSVIGPHEISSANTAADIQLQKRGIQTNPDGESLG
jgi:hypothetical protein